MLAVVLDWSEMIFSLNILGTEAVKKAWVEVKHPTQHLLPLGFFCQAFCSVTVLQKCKQGNFRSTEMFVARRHLGPELQ